MILQGNDRTCAICVMTEDATGVVIGTDGQCNCCKDAFARLPSEWWPNAEGERKMTALVAQLREEGKGKPYDALVGLSGGVDSAYLAHVMAARHDLRLLAVHVDAGWNSEPAVHNIEKLVRGLDLDLITRVVEWDEVRDVQQAFLRASVLNQDFPQDHAFFATLLRIAREHDVKSFLSGVNFSSENLQIPHDGPSSTDGKHVRAVHAALGKRPLRSYPVMTMTEYLWTTRVRGLPKRHRPLDFMNYDKEVARRELQEHYGWRDYGPKHSESRFTKFYQEVYLPRKLRFDKRRMFLSSLIVAGQMTRDAALAELAAPVTTPMQAERDTRFVAKKLGMSENELRTLIDAPIVSHDVYGSDKRLTDQVLNIRSALRRVLR
ncbi:N-acetyl sugar amidotransferase [uncultured Sphingomonas sp.]|uniref:N-acetyl sugar amidotransferase n=1 Tax=uncultured Sphingomonas sp. TaxID=158754 RepID=UPI0035CA8157